jgi:excisionase family DNA binding protein
LIGECQQHQMPSERMIYNAGNNALGRLGVLISINLATTEIEVMCMKFNFRPKIFSDESMGSYMHRLAFANRYQSTSAFEDYLSTSTSKMSNNEFTDTSLLQIAELTDYEKTDFEKHINALYGEDLGKGHMQKNRIKYCPDCVRENYYHKTIWHLRPITACVKHQCVLIEKCGACDAYISLSSFMMESCQYCGYHFRDKQADFLQANHLHIKSQAFIQQKLLGNNNDHIGNLNIKDYMFLAQSSFHLLEGLECVVDKTKCINAFFRKKDCTDNIISIANAFANLFWMYEDFPRNLYDVLDRFQKKHFDIRYEQKAQFEILFINEAFTVIRAAYENYWVDQLDAGIVRKDFSVFKTDKNLLSRRVFSSKEELKNTWGLTSHSIERIISAPSVAVTEVIRGEIVHKKINIDQFEAAVRNKENYITREKAAALLGIQKDSVKKVIKAGHLSLSFEHKKNGMIDVRKVKKLLKISRGVYTTEIHGKIGFYDALIKHSVNALQLTDLIELTKIGRLTAYHNKQNGKFDDVYYDINELTACIGLIKYQKREKDGYFLTDVLKMIKIGERAMHEFIKHGLLVPYRTVTLKDGRKRYLFSKDVVEDFTDRHVTVDQAAARFNISTSKLRKWIQDGKLEDKARGLCRSYLIEVEQVNEQIKCEKHK